MKDNPGEPVSENRPRLMS